MKHMIHLDRNESSLTHSPSVLKTMIENEDLSHYFDEEIDSSLKEELSSYTHLPIENLMLANGSTNFLRLLANIYIHGPSDEVVSLFPTYIDFVEFIEFQGGTMKVHQITPDQHDELVDNDQKYKLLEYLVNHNTRIIYLCSPNNPIDFIWTPDEVAYLCQKFPDVIILVDQAYYEFQRFGDPIMSWAGTKIGRASCRERVFRAV